MVLRNVLGRGAKKFGVYVAPKIIENYETAILMQGPYNPNGTTRIDSILATNHYRYGQVGFGVNGCIKMIYIGMRTYGEAEIGSVFCSRNVQNLLSAPSTWPDHLAVAKAEVKYWQGIAENPKDWEQTIGSNVATIFNAQSRVVIQESMEQFRNKLLGKN